MYIYIYTCMYVRMCVCVCLRKKEMKNEWDEGKFFKW